MARHAATNSSVSGSPVGGGVEIGRGGVEVGRNGPVIGRDGGLLGRRGAGGSELAGGVVVMGASLHKRI